MKKLAKMILSVFLAVALGVFTPRSLHAVTDEDFERDPDYYAQLCVSRGLTDEQKATCKLYSAYIERKISAVKESIEGTKSEISSIEARLDEIDAQIRSLQTKIDGLNTQITLIEEQIVTLTANIEQLKIEIEQRNIRIDELNNQIMDRMVNIQPFVSLNKYIEFIMGATDFTDLLRRTSAVNEIMEYDTGQIKLLEEEKEKLRLDMEELQETKNDLSQKENLLKETLQTVKDAKAEQVRMYDIAKQQQEALMIQLREQQSLSEELNTKIREIAESLSYIPPSSGLIYPVNGYFWISGGCPTYYPGGTTEHKGVDFAASMGTPIVAVANGVIAMTSDGYPNWGYIGDYVGTPSGGGNSILEIFQVNGETYAIYYNHMMAGHYVSVGDVVSQGQALGRVGSSGNASGPHTHIDLFYLGSISIQQALNDLTWSISFGAGWGLSGMCDRKGYAPCRLNPQNTFNVYYGFEYYP
ncbi:MAG: peptidoglycan DD-metalloendopeptidase family protein [Erysipelotrichales bacterium]|nr:peptidoglycan DD-metalloendopeptidase family protein [Erysipelotrichales bacterium]